MSKSTEHTPTIADVEEHYEKPWRVEAGTAVKDALGKTILCACEEGERRGGRFWGIRFALIEMVEAVNNYASLKSERDELRKACQEIGKYCETKDNEILLGPLASIRAILKSALSRTKGTE